MDLPKYYFPMRLCPHLGEAGDNKMAFADYGSCSNVHIPEDVNDGFPKGIPQRAHGRLEGLDKILPMLPISESLTVKDPDKARDCILGFDNYMNLYKSVDELLKLSTMSLKLKMPSISVSKLEEFELWGAKLRDLQEKIKGHNSSTCQQLCGDPSIKKFINGVKNNMPTWMTTIHDHYSWLQRGHDENCFKGFNRDYYKGLLCSIIDESSSPTLFHAGGLDFREINMTNVSTDDRNLQKVEKTMNVIVEEPVYQVSSSKRGVLSVRHKDKCTVLAYDTSEHSLKAVSSVSSRQNLLSDVCLSPFLTNEILLSEKSGTVSLCDINTKKCHHLSKLEKFECKDRWTSSYFAGHPRQIMIADRTSVEVFDHRDSFQKGTDLFTLSSLLVKNELVGAAIPMDFPYHVIGTDYTVFMMDQRFPCFPVFQWHLERMSNPQMLHFTKFSQLYNEFKSEAFVFVGTQQPAEILCLPVSLSDDSPPISKVLPWQVSNPRAIFKEESQSMGIDWCDFKQRFQMSMVGMTVVDESNPQPAFSVYQMDCYGDLFYQKFAFAERFDSDYLSLRSENKKFCLKEPLPRVRKAGRERVRKCLSNLNAFETQVESDSVPSHSQTDTSCQLRFSEMSEIFTTSTECTDGIDKISQPEEINFTYELEKVLKPWRSLPCEQVNTQLLIALKEGEDITELLEEREKDHEEKKIEMRERSLRKSVFKRKRKMPEQK